jgi:hypothetical protein
MGEVYYWHIGYAGQFLKFFFFEVKFFFHFWTGNISSFAVRYTLCTHGTLCAHCNTVAVPICGSVKETDKGKKRQNKKECGQEIQS